MAIPIKIGNYKLGKTLGSGSFGKVKLGINEITQQKVAVKILKKSQIKKLGMFDKIKREIKILKLFNHPHIIKLFDFIDTSSDIFVILEYASGGELFDLISRQEKLEECDARRLFQQLISGLDYAHQHKIAHRDLKPENLLFDSNMKLKIGDFGLCNIMKDGSSLKTSCGSPNYAAPEVISATFYDGKQVDVWSCGVILYAMLSGQLPFDEDQMPALFHRIKKSKFYMPNYISDDAKDLISRLLQPLPIKRMKLDEIKSHSWFKVEIPIYLERLLNKKSLVITKSESRQQNRSSNQYQNEDIDQDIVNQLFNLNLNLNPDNRGHIIDQIKDRKNIDFCVVYEFLAHQKLLDTCFSDDLIQCANKNNEGCIKSEGIKSKRNQVSDKQKQRLKWINNKWKNPQQYCFRKLQKNNFKKTEDRQMSFASTQCHSIGQDFDSPILESQNQNINEQLMILQKQASFQESLRKLLPKIPKQFGLMFKGNVNDFIRILTHCMVSANFQWQTSYKDIKFKCRTKLTESDIWDDLCGDSFLDDFMRNDFIKFYVQLFKWNKELPDVYYLDVTFIKAAQNCVLLNKILDLIEDVKKKIKSCSSLQHIATLTMIEETLPNKGQGFELVPNIINSDNKRASVQEEVSPNDLSLSGTNIMNLNYTDGDRFYTPQIQHYQLSQQQVNPVR